MVPPVTEETIDIPRRHFAQVPDLLATDSRLSSNAVRVYLRLDRYAGADKVAFPSIERLADDVHMSRSGVDRALKELVRAGWVSRTKRGMSNVIDTELHDTPAGVPGNVTGGVPAGRGGNVTGGVSPGDESPGNVTGDASETSPVTHLKKDNQFKERGGLSDLAKETPAVVTAPARRNDDEGQLPPVVPVLATDRCPGHDGTDSDAPCRACGAARRAYAASVEANARSLALRARALELRHHAAVRAQLREADRSAVDMSGGGLRARVAAARAERMALEAAGAA
jgi:hypothetical protein